jgi:hypothetical protein
MRGGFSLIDTGSKWRAASFGFSVLPCLQSWHRQSADPKTVFFPTADGKADIVGYLFARDIRPSPRRRDAASARRSVFVERKCDLHAGVTVAAPALRCSRVVKPPHDVRKLLG